MFFLPDLPYAYDALEPTMSARTLHFHHDKHQGAYVKALNELIDKDGDAPTDLESVIRAAAKSGATKLFNNAAQAWNHAFFWNCMAPNGGKPDGDLDAAIRAEFWDFAKLGETFVEQGVAHFGSGWAWLIADQAGRLFVKTTHDATDMVADAGFTPLLVCDLWEHAYYLDFQNDRKKFLEAWFEGLPNWEFAASQFAAAAGRGQAWRYPAPAAALGARAA